MTSPINRRDLLTGTATAVSVVALPGSALSAMSGPTMRELAVKPWPLPSTSLKR